MAAPKKYPDELRARAVRLYRASSPRLTFRQLGEQLGVHHEALRPWVRQAEADVGKRDDRPSSAENEELRRLRKEVVELRRTNGILTAASAFSPRNRPDKETVLAFIAVRKNDFGVESLGRLRRARRGAAC